MSVEVRGADELARKLATPLAPALTAILKGVALEIQDKIAPYPPASEANSSSEKRWYVRGYGPHWRTRAGVKSRKTSQQLGRRWNLRSTSPSSVILENTATYSRYVHDADKQAWFHKARGWVTDATAVQQVKRSGAIERIVTQAVRKALRV